MKRRFKEKHQGSSSDRGGDKPRTQEELISSNVFPEKDISEERESDGQAEDRQDEILGKRKCEKVQTSLPRIPLHGHDIPPPLPTGTQVTEPGQTEIKQLCQLLFHDHLFLPRVPVLHGPSEDPILSKPSSTSFTRFSNCDNIMIRDPHYASVSSHNIPPQFHNLPAVYDEEKYFFLQAYPGTSRPTVSSGSQVDASHPKQPHLPIDFCTRSHGSLKPVVAEPVSSDQFLTGLKESKLKKRLFPYSPIRCFDLRGPKSSNKDILKEATGGFKQKHPLQHTQSRVVDIRPLCNSIPTDFDFFTEADEIEIKIPVMLEDEPSCSPSSSSVNATPLPQNSEEEILKEDAGRFSLVLSEKEPGLQLQGETEPLVPTKQFPATNMPSSSSRSQFPNTDSSETREPSRPSPRSPLHFTPKEEILKEDAGGFSPVQSETEPGVQLQKKTERFRLFHFCSAKHHNEQMHFLQDAQTDSPVDFFSRSLPSVDAPTLPQSSEEEILKEGGDEISYVQLEDEPEPLNLSSVKKMQSSSSHSPFPNAHSSETRETSRPSPRSHSAPSLSPATCAETKILTRSQSLPELKLNSSFEDFTPDISVDEDDETYRFQCSCPGLYQCTVTGLVFHMEGGGDVVYRTVPWNRRQLSQHHKKPAGPLFDIKCDQQSVCQLHVPHCEVLSTGGVHFLSVAHVTDEVIEFIRPQKITETHVVINITGFSSFGNVKEEDSPPDPVRALVLLFYRPPDDPDPKSFLNVLLVPRNIVLRELQRTRRDERYIEPSPHCKLQPNQFYTLSTCPQNRSVKIEPPEAEFDEDFHSSYFTTFQVIIKTSMKKIKLVLKHKSSSNTVWKRRVYLPSTTERKSCEQCALNPPPNQRLGNIQRPMSTGNRKSSGEKLLDVRSSFIEGISEPVLKSLLDKLLEKKVINDSENESMDEKQNRRDKATFVMDTVRRKGEAASSEMIDFLCELDPFLCGHLGLM